VISLLAAGILKDIGGRVGGQGPVEPEVRVGDAGGRGDLGALLLGGPEPAGVQDLEDVLGLGVGGACSRPCSRPCSMPIWTQLSMKSSSHSVALIMASRD
jgi:hypothetical protein